MNVLLTSMFIIGLQLDRLKIKSQMVQTGGVTIGECSLPHFHIGKLDRMYVRLTDV